jgi:hypothetical protein
MVRTRPDGENARRSSPRGASKNAREGEISACSMSSTEWCTVRLKIVNVHEQLWLAGCYLVFRKKKQWASTTCVVTSVFYLGRCLMNRRLSCLLPILLCGCSIIQGHSEQGGSQSPGTGGTSSSGSGTEGSGGQSDSGGGGTGGKGGSGSGGLLPDASYPVDASQDSPAIPMDAAVVPDAVNDRACHPQCELTRCLNSDGCGDSCGCSGLCQFPSGICLCSTAFQLINTVQPSTTDCSASPTGKTNVALYAFLTISTPIIINLKQTVGPNESWTSNLVSETNGSAAVNCCKVDLDNCLLRDEMCDLNGRNLPCDCHSISPIALAATQTTCPSTAINVGALCNQ